MASNTGTGHVAFNVGGTIVETTYDTVAATGSDRLLKEAAKSGQTVFIDVDARHFIPLINYGRARARVGSRRAAVTFTRGWTAKGK